MLLAGRYTDRPAQADQLHFDLWWRGKNVACDAGTYLYNGLEPWTNALAASGVHNTVTVAGRDQMTRAGRFLWVDWAQAECGHYPVGQHGNVVVACQYGYKKLGAEHQRSVLSTDSDADDQIRGCRSLYYGEKVPALSLVAASRVPSRFITVLAPAEVVLLKATETKMRLRSNGNEYAVSLRRERSGRVFSGISFSP